MTALKPEDIKPDTFPNAFTSKKVPVLAGLPDMLKDPANYKKIRLALLDTLASTHSHSDLAEWHNCAKCQMKVQNHAEMIRKLGFTSPAQYFAWRKVSEKVEERMKLR
jgi:hypothetical protein